MRFGAALAHSCDHQCLLVDLVEGEFEGIPDDVSGGVEREALGEAAPPVFLVGFLHAVPDA